MFDYLQFLQTYQLHQLDYDNIVVLGHKAN